MRILSIACVGLAAATVAQAHTVSGHVDLIEKGGRKGDASEVVVYLEGAKAKPRPESTTIAMKGKEFVPRVVVVPVGSTVSFPNQDPLFHNVFSVSGENRFDLDRYKKPDSRTWTFQKPGVVRVYCNIHPQMIATVLVVESGFYARPASDGTFTIENVPAGDYSLRAWHERGGDAAVDVKVGAGSAPAPVPATLSLDTSSYKRLPHKNKYGKDYSASDSY